MMTAKATNIRWGRTLAAGLAVLAAAAIEGTWVARAQQAPDAAGPCTRAQSTLTAEDREAIGRVVLNRIKEKVRLSDQQAADIQATLKGARDAARADWQALCQARVALRTLMDDQTSDPMAFRTAAEQVKALQAKLLDRRLDTHLTLRSKLTADQWAKWVELRKERAGRWRRGGPAFSS